MIKDISQATLDVIEAIKQKGAVKFTYKDKDVTRYIKPAQFYGEFEGFEGVDVALDEYRKFSFKFINRWDGYFASAYVIQNNIDKLEEAVQKSREITKEAKGLSYPVVEIMCKLERLAETVGLESDMESMLDDTVREAQHNLESSFYHCESVFEEALRTLEIQLEEAEL
jgi:hypothetical protein